MKKQIAKKLLVDDPNIIFMNSSNPFRDFVVKYDIIDNGGVAFIVFIKNKHIEIHKGEYDFDENINRMSTNPILTYDAEIIWIGRSPLNAMTHFSGGFNNIYDGNSILIKLSNDEYIYIGREIYSFKPLAPIKYYVSPMGNSGTAYPFAIDKDENYYLMSEDVIMLKHKFTTDPYDDYYDNHVENTGTFMYNNVKVNSLIIDDNRYGLHYYPSAAHEYDRLSQNGTLKMYVGSQNKKYPIDKNGYIKLMENYGKLNKLVAINKNRLAQNQ